VLLTGAGVGKPEEAPVEAAEAPEIAPEKLAADAETAIPKPASPKPAAPEPILPEPEALADEKVALSPALWHDPDVRWLTGVHEAEDHAYLVRELYEELLWWLLMPSLLRLAGEAAPSRAAAAEMSKTIEEALATAESAGYRIDILLGGGGDADAGETPEEESGALEAEPEAVKAEPDEADVKAL